MTRNLRRCIRDAGAAIQVEVELVRTTIRLRKPRSRVIPIYWPILSMKNWCEVLMRKYPKVLLGGYDLEQSLIGKVFSGGFGRPFTKMIQPILSLHAMIGTPAAPSLTWLTVMKEKVWEINPLWCRAGKQLCQSMGQGRPTCQGTLHSKAYMFFCMHGSQSPKNAKVQVDIDVIQMGSYAST